MAIYSLTRDQLLSDSSSSSSSSLDSQFPLLENKQTGFFLFVKKYFAFSNFATSYQKLDDEEEPEEFDEEVGQKPQPSWFTWDKMTFSFLFFTESQYCHCEIFSVLFLDG